MKIRMYMDINPQFPHSVPVFYASNTPSSYKSPETVRIAFDVHVDEKLIYKYDAIANEVSKPVEVSNVISEEE